MNLQPMWKVLSPKNLEQQLLSIPMEKWNELFELIPTIEATTNFGDVPGGINSDGELWISSESDFSPIVNKFLSVVYDIPIIISFDWPHWDEGRAAMNDETDFSKFDVAFLCKLVTAVVRSDRFCTGVLLDVFESGRMLGILKAMEKQVNGD